MSYSSTQMNWMLTLLRLKCRVEKKWREITKAEKNVYVWSRIPFYKAIWEKAASELSARFIELGEGIWEIRYGNQSTLIHNHMVQIDDPVISSLAANKSFCYSLLKNNRLPVPQYLTFRYDQLIQVKRFMKENKGFFVIKPAAGTSAGMGITTFVQSFRECFRAIALASLYSNEIIIERLIPGECYRLLILNGVLIHASRRSGIKVKGDGKSTILQLMEKGKERPQKIDAKGPLLSVHQDFDCKTTLEAQGLSIESIPRIGQDILVKSFNNSSGRNQEVRTVYDKDVTHLICDDLRVQAVRAAQLLNTKFAGIDVITCDPSVSLEKSGGVINEINTTPGLQHHYNLLNNGKKNPAVHVLRYLLKISPE